MSGVLKCEPELQSFSTFRGLLRGGLGFRVSEIRGYLMRVFIIRASFFRGPIFS